MGDLGKRQTRGDASNDVCLSSHDVNSPFSCLPFIILKSGYDEDREINFKGVEGDGNP